LSFLLFFLTLEMDSNIVIYKKKHTPKGLSTYPKNVSMGSASNPFESAKISFEPGVQSLDRA
jgi:hypothetical protein